MLAPDREPVLHALEQQFADIAGILFFLLGVFARLVKSDLRLPEALYETLSIYLLLAIGL